MSAGIIVALAAVYVTAAPSRAEQSPALTYHSPKTVAALQVCLTDKLTSIGEVVAIKLDQATTALVLRNVPEGAMTIELAPGSVTVTSKPARGTSRLIKACL